MLFDLSGRTAIITGVAGLLGKAHSHALLAKNANIVLTDIDEKKLFRLEKLLKIEYPNSNICSSVMDVTSENSIQNTFDALPNWINRIDILINNAALNPSASSLQNNKRTTRLENFSIKRWKTEVDIGLTGAFLCSKFFGSRMAMDGKGGVILNIASDLSVIAPDQRLYKQESFPDELQAVKPVSYSVVKTGLIGLTRYLSTYWADKGVRANALSPGGVFEGQDSEFVKRLENLIPMGRMATINEYVGAVQFLCSDASAYMTGQNLVIDGGRSTI